MSLRVNVIALDRTIWGALADEVILPGSTGQLGILKGHAPFLTSLDVGLMRIRVNTDWVSIVLMGGLAEVEDDAVTVLVTGAEEVLSLDEQVEKKELEEMTIRFNNAVTAKEKIEATINLRRARARVQASRF